MPKKKKNRLGSLASHYCVTRSGESFSPQGTLRKAAKRSAERRRGAVHVNPASGLSDLHYLDVNRWPSFSFLVFK